MTFFEEVVPVITLLLASSSLKFTVPNPVKAEPPEIVARSCTVTLPAVTTPVGDRIVVFSVGLALPTVKVSVVTSGGAVLLASPVKETTQW